MQAYIMAAISLKTFALLHCNAERLTNVNWQKPLKDWHSQLFSSKILKWGLHTAAAPKVKKKFKTVSLMTSSYHDNIQHYHLK